MALRNSPGFEQTPISISPGMPPDVDAFDWLLRQRESACGQAINALRYRIQAAERDIKLLEKMKDGKLGKTYPAPFLRESCSAGAEAVNIDTTLRIIFADEMKNR